MARMRKSFGGFDALIDSPSLTREKRSEGSRDSWLSRNLAGMRLPSMGRSPLPKATPAPLAELPLNKIRLNEECLVQVLEKMGVSARRADVSKMAEEYLKHQTSTGKESAEVCAVCTAWGVLVVEESSHQDSLSILSSPGTV